MKEFITISEVRWADLDPNFHVLHSKYYDFGAHCRMVFLVEHGLTAEVMQELHMGPILFREECFFKRELKFGDQVSVNLKLSKMTSNYARWSMEHEVFKNGNILSATMNIDGAWLDTQKRKLAIPPSQLAAIFDAMPRTANFQLIEK